MKIAHYAWPTENFGDAPLNNWLIPRLFPWMAPTGQPDTILMGIGSILGHRSLMPEKWRTLPWVVYGSGQQYGQLDIPSEVSLFAVRGPYTLSKLAASGPLKAPRPVAFGDPAVLLPIYLPRTGWPEHQVGRVTVYNYSGPPGQHQFRSLVQGDFIDFVKKLWSYERIECDAMHVAIVCDAYGIPWKPARWESKWVDHFTNLGVHWKPNDFILSDRGRLAEMQTGLLVAKDVLKEYVFEVQHNGTGK